MIHVLFEQHNFDPTQPGQLLIVEHKESVPLYRLSPLVIVTTEEAYRITIAAFSNGKMVPSQSVTFDQDDKPLAATTFFGTPVVDLEQAVTDLSILIADNYLGTEAEYHQVES